MKASLARGDATELRSLALPGHTFKVVALDGNPVPRPHAVQVLWIGTGERISAVVEMKQSGVWVLGDLADDDRAHGMGIVVGYAGGGFNRWTINDVAFDMQAMNPMFHLNHGKRYRLRMYNASDDIHPMHLHRHSFEITRIAGRPTSGVIKDVVMFGGYQTMDVDFTADQLGLSLFHCHMQLHMDFGFVALFDCA